MTKNISFRTVKFVGVEIEEMRASHQHFGKCGTTERRQKKGIDIFCVTLLLRERVKPNAGELIRLNQFIFVASDIVNCRIGCRIDRNYVSFFRHSFTRSDTEKLLVIFSALSRVEKRGDNRDKVRVAFEKKYVRNWSHGTTHTTRKKYNKPNRPFENCCFESNRFDFSASIHLPLQNDSNFFLVGILQYEAIRWMWKWKRHYEILDVPMFTFIDSWMSFSLNRLSLRNFNIKWLPIDKDKRLHHSCVYWILSMESRQIVCTMDDNVNQQDNVIIVTNDTI